MFSDYFVRALFEYGKARSMDLLKCCLCVEFRSRFNLKVHVHNMDMEIRIKSFALYGILAPPNVFLTS